MGMVFSILGNAGLLGSTSKVRQAHADFNPVLSPLQHLPARPENSAATSWLGCVVPWLLPLVQILAVASQGIAQLTNTRHSAAAGPAGAGAPAKEVGNLGEGMLEGGKALAKGVLAGAVGILAKPMEGAEKGGVPGFLEGITKVRMARAWRAAGRRRCRLCGVEAWREHRCGCALAESERRHHANVCCGCCVAGRDWHGRQPHQRRVCRRRQGDRGRGRHLRAHAGDHPGHGAAPQRPQAPAPRHQG